MPHALTIAGLPAVLQDMADDLIVEGFEVELDINNFPNTMLDNKQATIFRLIQELISNIKKHALAKSILIQLFCVDKSLSLIVEDDGRGFDYHQAYKKAGIGLKNITSRVAFLNGSIDWDTAKLKGTTVTINIPL